MEACLSEELTQIRERQSVVEARLGMLERALEEILGELKGISTVLRGNGERGLVAGLGLAEERISALQGQWRWLAGILVGLLIAALKSIFWG